MQTTLIGNLAKISDLRTTSAGEVIDIDIAINKRAKTQQGTWEETGETTWIKATCWNYQAKAWDHVRPKGRVIATGDLEEQTYETKNGETRTKLVLKNATIGLLPSLPKSETPPAQNNRTSYTAPKGGSEHDPWAVNAETEMPPF